METLLETKEAQYKELFDATTISKLHELQSTGTVKVVLAKVLQLLTGVVEHKPVASPKPAAAFPDLGIVSEPASAGTIDLIDPVLPAATKESKPNAFTFIKQTAAAAPEQKAGMFAHMKMAPKPAAEKASGFSFMKKGKESPSSASSATAPKKTASGLEGLDLDFVDKGAVARPLTDLTGLDIISDPVFPAQSPVQQQQQPAAMMAQMPPNMFVPAQTKTPMMVPNIYNNSRSAAKDEDDGRSKVDDKYFGFVNEEL